MEIKRDAYLDALIRKKWNGRAKIITGIRRSGKSYLLFKLFKNHLLGNGVSPHQLIEIQLDEIESIRFRNPFELNDFIKSKITDPTEQYYVFIDEIQLCAEVPNPYLNDPNEKITFVDTILGLIKLRNVDVYVTGSNSRMLSKDILTQFRDRGDEIRVFPLAYQEFLPAYEKTNSARSPMSGGAISHSAWRDYCTFGGLPYVLTLETPEEKSRYLQNLFDETYVRDIIERNKILNDREVLDILLDFVASAVGSLTNPTKLSRRFLSESKIRISHSTITKYLEYFCDAFLLDRAKRYDIRGGAYFGSPVKYYFTDIGLRNARLNFRQIEETHIMENILFNDLVRRGFSVDVGVIESTVQRTTGSGDTERSRTQLEVDFVVNRSNQRVYIQSAYSLSDPQKRDQETRPLNRIGDSFRKIVVVRDSVIPWYDEKGIYTIGIEEFLLRDDIL